jgi:hypothetical protein
VPCQNSFVGAQLVFLRSLGCSSVFADEAADVWGARTPPQILTWPFRRLARIR